MKLNYMTSEKVNYDELGFFFLNFQMYLLDEKNRILDIKLGLQFDCKTDKNIIRRRIEWIAESINRASYALTLSQM